MSKEPKTVEKRNRANKQGGLIQDQQRALHEGRFGDAIEAGKECRKVDEYHEGKVGVIDLDEALRVIRANKGAE